MDPAAYASLIDVPRSLWDPTEGPHSRHGERAIEDITVVEIHWTGAPGSIADHGDTGTELLAFERYHEISRGWYDLFYNLGLDTDGIIYEGRDVTIPSQTNLRDTLTVVVVVGPDDPPLTVAEREAILGGIFRIWHAVDPTMSPASLRTHRERASTTCPGVIQDLVNEIRAGWRPADYPTGGTMADMSSHPDFHAAVAAGITNGTRPGDPASRSEAAIMAERARRAAAKLAVDAAASAADAGAAAAAASEAAAVAAAGVDELTARVDQLTARVNRLVEALASVGTI